VPCAGAVHAPAVDIAPLPCLGFRIGVVSSPWGSAASARALPEFDAALVVQGVFGLALGPARLHRRAPSWPAGTRPCARPHLLVVRSCLVGRWVRLGPAAKPAAKYKAARATSPTARPTPGQQPNCGWYWHFVMSLHGYLLFIGRVYKHGEYI
jgi:hypothetical protein